jgi:Capsule assembly protein Wzi/PAP2 superfamily
LQPNTRLLAGLLSAVMILFAISDAHSQDSAQESKPAPQTVAPEPKKSDMVSAPPASTPSESAQHKFFVGPITDFAQDQKQIWTSPAHIRLVDAKWLVPLAGVTAGLFVTDQQYSASLSTNPSTISHYQTISNVGIASLAGVGAGMYLMSFPTHNEHWRETGWLAGEAAIDSLIPIEAMKYSFGRERPYQGNGSGAFFQGDTSFPSEHAAAAWAIAGVIAHEYPGTLPKIVSYGLASAVSFARVHGRQHFPSDVFVGSVLGYLVAQSVYSRRHDSELRGSSWASPREWVEEGNKAHSPAYMGSPYVPLDSWVYPAMERLAALGYLKTVSLGIRPWTRLECARLLMEASELEPEADGPLEVQQLYSVLSEEFAHDSELVSGERNLDAQLESIYSRALGISGRPLTDNFHFGQTVLNDYGRPYGEGFNAVAGASGWSTAGPFVVYARGEYESASSAPAPSLAELNFFHTVDSWPNSPALPVAAISRFQLLDAYVGMNLANWQLSYGKRSLWWGPSDGGTMLFTNNAAPLNNMFSIDRVAPFRLPWIFAYLGEMRLSAFIGQLSGTEFQTTLYSGTTNPTPFGQYGQALHPQPFLSGEKVSFKFTENFEFTMSKTTIYGGPGNPLTIKTFLQSTFGIRVDGDLLGDGRSAIDFSYRIPKLRNWLSLYGEGFTEDEISPINEAPKSIWQGGLYLAKVPRANKFDLRLEGGYTSPTRGSFCTTCFYTNGQYNSGYNNDGYLIGTWLGRASQGELIRTNYWLGPRKKIGIELRHRKIDSQYLPQGGTQNDVALNADIFTGAHFRFTGNLQYESWQIPLLAPNSQNNVAASFEIGFWPQGHLR